MDENGQTNDPGSGFGGVRHRLRYRFDNLLARGTSSVLLWLGVVTLAAVVLSSLLLVLFGVTLSGSEEGSWLEDMWQSLLRILDTGTMAADVGWGRRILALAVTIFGVLVAGTLIGVIAAGVEDRVDRMRRGRSVVIEKDHVVVLGASERLPVVIQQLVLANRRSPGQAIVVMADRDPSEMKDAVDEVVTDRLGTRLVYRSGDPTRRADLALVRLQAARTVIVLADADGDTAAVRTVLAIGAEVGGFDHLSIVVETHHPSTADRLVRACGPRVHPILPTQTAARTASFALRDAGLTRVIDELLDFGGCDIYLYDDPTLAGLPFRRIVRLFPKARPIARVRVDGTVDLNPSPEIELGRGERVAVVADEYGPLATEAFEQAAEPPTPDPTTPPPDVVAVDHLLVIGWNPFGAELIANWARLANTGSTVEVMIDPARFDPDSVDLDAITLEHVTLVTDEQPATRLRRPDGEPPVSTIVLLTSHDTDPRTADAHVLLELAELRAALRSTERPRFVVEVRDVASLPLVDLPGADDYVVSDAVGSRFIAQLAVQPERRSVFLALYAAVDASLRLDPVEQFGLVGDFSAAEVFSAVYAAGLTAFGWRHSPERNSEIVLNPHGSDRVVLRPGDMIVSIG